MYISCWTTIDSMYSASQSQLEGNVWRENLWCKNVTNCLLMSHANMIKVGLIFVELSEGQFKAC